jgi:hypothetical protein
VTPTAESIRADEVRVGDWVEFEKTSAGVRLPRWPVRVVAVQQHTWHDSETEEEELRIWLQLDARAPGSTGRLGTFLLPETEVDVWR